MPIDDLTALGLKMREARKNKELTQQELSIQLHRIRTSFHSGSSE